MKKHLKSILEKTVTAFGGTVIGKKAFGILTHQHLALLEEAANLYRPTLTKQGAVGYLFSFNRPVQAHACLASYFHHAKNPVPMIVQYRATTPQAGKAYDDVKRLLKKHPVTFVEETTCRETLLKTLATVKHRKIFFLVDDIVFINPVDMNHYTALDPLKTVPTLRLHPKMSFNYTCNMPQKPPAGMAPSTLAKGMMQWTWGEADNEWNDPCSVDGNLFDTAEAFMMIKASPFKAPNTLEGAMKMFAPLFAKRPGLCYKKAVFFNNPCNRVQTENDNRAGTTTSATSPQEFINQWNKGLRINYEALTGLVTPAPHHEVPFSFIRREK